ncbi:unnamed protein product, partial [Ectocarpus sp. 8 AP-2014]
ASTPKQQEEVVPLAGAQMPSAQQSPARAAPVVTRESARVSGRCSPSPKPPPTVTLPSRGRASAVAVVTNGVGADASGLEEANGVPVITAAAAAGPPTRASGLRAPRAGQVSAGATGGGAPAAAGAASGPGAAFTMETGEVALAVVPRSTSVPQPAVPAAPAAAAPAAAAAVVAGLAVASDGSAVSSPLTDAGGIAGDRRKKAWQARKTARSVPVDFSEQPSRRQGKRQAKRQEELRAKAGRERPSAAVQPGAEHGNSPTTATAASGGSGSTVTTAVASKTLSRPAGRPEDLAISALNRARRAGGARGATKDQRSSNKNVAGFDNGGGSGVKGCVIEEDTRRQQRRQQQQQQSEEGFVRGAASPESQAHQEERGGVTVRKVTPQEWKEENEGVEKKEEEENGKEEETERVNGRPASPQAPSGAPDQGATHAAASTDSEGRCYDKEVALSKKLLSFNEAESFLALNVPGVEGVYSMGQTIDISIRGDGNCFWTSCCLAVLLWALCQDCSQQLQDLLARYRAIRRGSRAHDALSLDMK